MSETYLEHRLKLEIRTDLESGAITAAVNVAGERIPVGTLSIAVADANRDVYDAWVKTMEFAFQRMLESAGFIPAGMQRMVPPSN